MTYGCVQVVIMYLMVINSGEKEDTVAPVPKKYRTHPPNFNLRVKKLTRLTGQLSDLTGSTCRTRPERPITRTSVPAEIGVLLCAVHSSPPISRLPSW